MSKLLAATLIGAGFVAGFATASYWPAGSPTAPETWVARIGDSYLTSEEFVAEMRQRGGTLPGQYRDPEQKRALLDTLIYQRVLVQAALDEGLDAEPGVRRARDQILANHFLQKTLRREQARISVDDQEVARFHESHEDDYAIPARRRVAMIHIPVRADADESAWARARDLAAEAADKARAMNGAVPHFGEIAREYSHDSASRFRGGVIGWIAEGQAERYRYDRAFIEAAYALSEPGAISEVLTGADGVYLARLVELEPRRVRGLEDLADGIRQRLLRERAAAVEEAFRRSILERVEIEVREDALAAIDPLAPPAAPDRREPPALPKDEG